MRKIDYFNKTISDQLGIDLKVVKEVNGFYWKEVRKLLSKAEYNAIFLKNLGTIAISRNKLRRQIKSDIGAIRSLRSLPYRTEKLENTLQSQIENLKVLLIRRNYLATFYYNNKRKWNKPK